VIVNVIVKPELNRKNMKKTYMQPTSRTKYVEVENEMLTGSLQKFDGSVDNGGWTKEDNSWDIWGESAVE